MRNRNSRRAIGRKRGLASARAWTPSAADADTLRRRALHDARGQIIREVINANIAKFEGEALDKTRNSNQQNI